MNAPVTNIFSMRPAPAVNPSREPEARLTIAEERLKEGMDVCLRFLTERMRTEGGFVVLSRFEAENLASFHKENLAVLERKTQASGYKRLVYDLIARLEARVAGDNHFCSARDQYGSDFRAAWAFLWNCTVDFQNFIHAAAKVASSHTRGGNFCVSEFERPLLDKFEELRGEFEDAAEAADERE